MQRCSPLFFPSLLSALRALLTSSAVCSASLSASVSVSVISLAFTLRPSISSPPRASPLLSPRAMPTDSSSAAPSQLSGHKRTAAAVTASEVIDSAAAVAASTTSAEFINAMSADELRLADFLKETARRFRSTIAELAGTNTAISSTADIPVAKRSKRTHDSANGASIATAADAAVRSAADASQALRSGGQAASPSHHRVAASAPRAHLLSVPDDVLFYLADAFLLDSDAVRCARTCHSAFLALRKYRIKGQVPFDEAIKFADTSSAAAQAAVEATEAETAATVRLSQPAAASSPPPFRSPWRIGRL